MMARERIGSQLEDLIAACVELFEEHGYECCCDGSSLVSNFVGSLRLYRLLVGDYLIVGMPLKAIHDGAGDNRHGLP